MTATDHDSGPFPGPSGYSGLGFVSDSDTRDRSGTVMSFVSGSSGNGGSVDTPVLLSVLYTQIQGLQGVLELFQRLGRPRS